MNRQFYIDMAGRGLQMPIGTDLVLHEEADPEGVRLNGAALGRVVERGARRWETPLAIPLMDLRLEKVELLQLLGITEQEAETFHFDSPIDNSTVAMLVAQEETELSAGSEARAQAVEYISSSVRDLVAVGMTIGPFSLATRLMADPITASGLAGTGVRPEDSDEVRLLQQCVQVAESAVLRSVRSQMKCGAKAIMVCEPAASTAFISPRQIRAGSDVFERFVMQQNVRLKQLLDKHEVDLIFHDCGELIPEMVEEFAHRLRPVILSLGSSRRLWEDAALVPKDIVLYGNLPSKSFYCSSLSCEEIKRLRDELITNMNQERHPFILGTECDVLFVPEAEDEILRKVETMIGRQGFGLP